MTLYLIRHASAGERGRWNGDDFERPLDEKGESQRDAIARHLAHEPVRHVWSSLAVRCRQTVESLAAALDVEVESRPELTEGASPHRLEDLLHKAAVDEDDVVLCSHGDLIPEVLNRLLRNGMAVSGPRGCAKGSIWTLETADGQIVRGSYNPAP